MTVDAARDEKETEQELMETIFRQSRKRKKEDVPARGRERSVDRLFLAARGSAPNDAARLPQV